MIFDARRAQPSIRIWQIGKAALRIWDCETGGVDVVFQGFIL